MTTANLEDLGRSARRGNAEALAALKTHAVLLTGKGRRLAKELIAEAIGEVSERAANLAA